MKKRADSGDSSVNVPELPENFLSAVAIASRKVFSLRGRADRREFWSWFLLAQGTVLLVVLATMFLVPPSIAAGITVVSEAIALALTFSACVRRLHDLGASGRAILSGNFGTGSRRMLRALAVPGIQAPNEYGPAPAPRV